MDRDLHFWKSGVRSQDSEAAMEGAELTSEKRSNSLLCSSHPLMGTLACREKLPKVKNQLKVHLLSKISDPDGSSLHLLSTFKRLIGFLARTKIRKVLLAKSGIWKNVHNRSCIDKDRVKGECLIGLGKVDLGFSSKEKSGSAEVRVEDSVQSMPPDAKIFCGKRKLERNASAEMNFAVHVLEKQSKESIQKIFGGSRKGDCRNKSVFNPLAHAKLFKTPRSFC
ncbi:hypothetical protein SLEP1_g28470 [Rubroshorea leprosula]|uniref:Uncharacterized protein n=1 Tax=Rubroshorea leprosula TaxID=152421 RepID=A0AAV5K621_9ROSI|nr:hypothetical protein SLEP1_g28470 [Rubroshorea leprosula]